jgi:hypothetical protein
MPSRRVFDDIAARRGRLYGRRMDKSGYAIFIDQCRRQRDTLLGLVDAMEQRRLAGGEPIAVPDVLHHATTAVVAGFRRTAVELDTLIAAYEAHPQV